MNLNKYKVFDLFEREKKSLFFREIVKKSGVSVGGVQKVLSDSDFLFDKKVRGRNTYYSIKKGVLGELFVRLIESERAILFIRKNPFLKDFLEKISYEKIPCLIFGSYASFTNKRNSDLDLFVLGEKNLPEHLSPVELHIVRARKKDMKKFINEKLIKEIRKNHIFISGFDFFMEAFNEKN